jgi:hypothetical protein
MFLTGSGENLFLDNPGATHWNLDECNFSAKVEHWGGYSAALRGGWAKEYG